MEPFMQWEVKRIFFAVQRVYVQGMRVAINSRKGPVYDLRAATEVFDDGSGRFVNVVEEWRFFSWHHMPPAERPPLVPRATCLPTRLVWAEVYDK